MFSARINRAELADEGVSGAGLEGITASLCKRRFYVSRF